MAVVVNPGLDRSAPVDWWMIVRVVLPDDWETTAEVIRETGRKVLGVSSGRRKEDKETWWWNKEVQDSIQRKRLAKKKWDMDRTEENTQEYKELQCRVKREVSKAKQKAYDELYTRLDTREGEKDLYRLARQRDRDGKDVQQVRVIKDRDGRVLTSEESVQRRWKEYFEELMNEENEREKRVEGVNSVEQKVDKIRKDEVRKALKRMKSGKAVGPDDIPVEVWKCLGEAAVEFLTSLFNRVLENLEKAYDRVPREELWYCMRKSGVAEKYVRVVQDMYERSRTVVRRAVVMDQLSEEVRQASPWTMMFADDIVICSESREQVEESLERWRLQGEEVKKGQEFKYLGSIVQSNGECGKEIVKTAPDSQLLNLLSVSRLITVLDEADDIIVRKLQELDRGVSRVSIEEKAPSDTSLPSGSPAPEPMQTDQYHLSAKNGNAVYNINCACTMEKMIISFKPAQTIFYDLQSPTCHQITTIQGKPLGNRLVQWGIPELSLHIGCLHEETIFLLVLEESAFDVILGCAWMAKNQPNISWSSGSINQWKPDIPPPPEVDADDTIYQVQKIINSSNKLAR
ncbi:hypothetical protein QTP70_007537 [Hemibagrus guttatus]|uniref:Reverse transcriptase domain-containing protein n=1 Tax=Hemibagrus guttatus TaxID=175788 RepID=A0AAE0UZT6_9TELE|nr:hypothetical protein QTP70_007537 [Hemibagrus guttatus]